MPNHRSLSPILGFDVSVAILLRKVVVCRDFILRAVATFWVMSLVDRNLPWQDLNNQFKGGNFRTCRLQIRLTGSIIQLARFFVVLSGEYIT